MSKFNRKSNKGFTLIELMIVVAIIGILAAIAIPNFLRFQLRSKSSEGKVNLAAIRTAEEGYLAEFGTYVAAALQPAAAPTSQKTPWGLLPSADHGFNTLGWGPEGDVFFQYQVVAGAPGTPVFTAAASADIDGDGTLQHWGYVKALPDGTGGVAAGAPAAACVATGVWNPTAATPGPSALSTVGPCNRVSGQSTF